jgi:cobalt-zinc-cadmium efflux system outer membrane protein
MRSCLFCVLVFASTQGCVGKSRGFDSAQTLIHDRSGVRVEQRDPEELAETRAVLEQLRSPLAAEGAIEVALIQNPMLQAAFERLAVARGELLGARLWPNPTVEVEATFDPDGGSPDLEGAFVLDLGGILRQRLMGRAAEASLRAAEVEAAGAALDLAYETRVAFYAHQADLQIVELVVAMTMTFRGAYETADALREAGNVQLLEVAQNRAAYEQARLVIASAELAALESREKLQVLMGLSGEATGWQIGARLEGTPLAPSDFDALETVAIDASLDLLGKSAQLEGLARNLDIVRSASVIPSLHAGIRAERGDNGWGIGPVVEFTVPLFDQGQGPRAAGAARLRAAQHQYLAMGVSVRSAARRLRNRYANAEARLARPRRSSSADAASVQRDGRWCVSASRRAARASGCSEGTTRGSA